MKYWLVAFLIICTGSYSVAQQLILPDSTSWNSLHEGTFLSFKIGTTDPEKPKFTLEGINGYKIQFDTLGNFSWNPGFDLVDRLEKQKEINLIVQAEWKDGGRV